MQWGVTVAAAMLLAGLASGCDKVTGGGWLASSADPLEEKATFGFTAKCKNTTVASTPVAVFYEGQLEYRDDGADIHIHGDVEPNEFADMSGATCRQAHNPFFAATMFEGRYRSQPDGAQGDFEVTVTDNGEPGSLNGDMFSIILTGAIEHVNSGPIQGGNIQIH